MDHFINNFKTIQQLYCITPVHWWTTNISWQ